MKFYNYINESKYLDIEIKKWQSDLRKMTKIYNSLNVITDENKSIELPKWMEAKKYFRSFFNNFEKWVYTDILQNPDDETWYEKEVRSTSWTAIMRENDIIKLDSAYDYDKQDHNYFYDTNKIVKNRKKTIDKYNRYFRDAFKALKELSDREGPDIKRKKLIKDFNIKGVNIQIINRLKDEEMYSGSIEAYINFVNNLKKYIDNLKSRGLGIVTKNLRIQIQYGGNYNFDTAGQYEIRDDFIKLTPMGLIETKRIEGTFYHELGHRYYYQIMSKKNITKWNDFISNNKVTITDKDIKNFVNKYYDILINKNFSKKIDVYNEIDLINFFEINGENSENYAIYAYLLRKREDEVYRDFRQDDITKEKAIEIFLPFAGWSTNKYFISDYSNKMPSEAWAEIFKLYAIGNFKKLKGMHKIIFKEIMSYTTQIKENKYIFEKYINFGPENEIL